MLLKNNLIAIVAYVSMCIILIPLNFVWHLGIWWGKMEMRSIISGTVTVSIHTIVSLCLCLWVGRKFLINTYNMLTNIFSVGAIAIIPVVVILAFYKNPLAGVLVNPIYPISETISYFLNIDLKHSYLLVSLLPSLTMWLGMITKR